MHLAASSVDSKLHTLTELPACIHWWGGTGQGVSNLHPMGVQLYIAQAQIELIGQTQDLVICLKLGIIGLHTANAHDISKSAATKLQS